MRKDSASLGLLRPALVLLAIALGTASIASADEGLASDADLTTAVRQLQKWRSSFTAIRVVWRDWYLPDIIKYHPECDLKKDLGVTYYTEQEFWWEDWGAFRRMSTTVLGGRTAHQETKLYVPDAGKPNSEILVMDGIYGLWNSRGKWLPDPLKGDNYSDLGRTGREAMHEGAHHVGPATGKHLARSRVRLAAAQGGGVGASA